MAEKKSWDMTSLHSCSEGTKWFRKKTGAAVVIVIREDGWVFCVDPEMKPKDAELLVTHHLPTMRQYENQRRIDARLLADAKAAKGGRHA